jgi:hypothetical protein
MLQNINLRNVYKRYLPFFFLLFWGHLAQIFSQVIRGLKNSVGVLKTTLFFCILKHLKKSQKVHLTIVIAKNIEKQ